MALSTEQTPKTIRGDAGPLYWISVATIFLVIQSTRDRLEKITSSLQGLFGIEASFPIESTVLFYAPSIKGLLFFLALSYLSLPIIRRILGSSSELHRTTVSRNLWKTTIAIGGLFALSFSPHLVSMGVGYAERSIDPFNQYSDWWYKRLLLPALSHFVFLRGGVLYLTSFWAATCLFVFLVISWTSKNTDLRFWQIFSLLTSSFVLYQFQASGYPEVLAYSFLLLATTKQFGKQAPLTFLTLAIATHEASLFPAVPIAWYFFEKRQQYYFVCIVLLYGLAWLSGFGFSLQSLWGSHDVEEKGTLDWVLEHPKRQFLGIFIAYKFLWILPVLAIIQCLRRSHWREALYISACIASSLAICFVAIDTSRLAGFAFPAFLFSLRLLSPTQEPRKRKNFFFLLFSLNLLLPSFYVGLNTGIVTKPGIYHFIFLRMWDVINLFKNAG